MTNDNDAPDYPATVARLEEQNWSPSRILSALGHPGYDNNRFAKRAVRRIKAGTHTPHQAVLGRREAAAREELLG